MLGIYNKSYYLYALIFFPVYITSSGLFVAEVTNNGLHLGERGLVFPISFIIGILMVASILINILDKKNFNRKIIENDIIKLYLTVLLFLFGLTSAGIFIFNNFNGLVKFGQFATGGVGIGISLYLFIYKKLDITHFFGKLSIVFSFIILLHFFTSIVFFQISPTTGNVYPSILGAGIYQSRVYYPYIVTVVFFSGLPYMIKKIGIYTLIPYLLFFFYVFTLQVRGALGSFILMTLLVIMLWLPLKYKIGSIFVGILSVPLILNLNTSNEFLGRFSEIEKIQDFNGRLDLWISVIESLNFKTFLFGTFMRDIDGVTAHNQYFEMLNLAGIIPFLLMFYMLIVVIRILLFSFKFKIKTLKIYGFIILTTLVIDLNINVPLLNTNPAIHYWFFWSSIYFYYLRVKEEVLNKHAI